MSNPKDSEDKKNKYTVNGSQFEGKPSSPYQGEKRVRTVNLGHKRYDPVGSNTVEAKAEQLIEEDTLSPDHLLTDEDESFTDHDLALEQLSYDEDVQLENAAGGIDSSDDRHMDDQTRTPEAEVDGNHLEQSEELAGAAETETRSRAHSNEQADQAEAEAKKTEENTRQKRRKAAKKEKKKLKVRLVPIWLRLLILIVLAAVALSVGAMIGYGVIGNGNPMDVFDPDTWKHIKDIVEA